MTLAKLNVWLPPHLHQWLTHERDRSGTSISVLVARALERVRAQEVLRVARAVRVEAAVAELAGRPLTERDLDRARVELGV